MRSSYHGQVPLTNQVPYLATMPGVENDERWGFWPFIGGLALGGLGGLVLGGGRPCCGGYNYPVYQQPMYYPQPVYYQQPSYPMGYQQQMVQNSYYGPYSVTTPPSQEPMIESNKYYIL